ncbi:urocanate hydratase [Murinocardiopsis flavida]|uniref:Urocanate hydratase n=1 Tax=Murinocardiopsis flavida TaxID=645275 RepID=A0A2P8DQD6_9ACTN|nr:urocanate hydratase [Murinocardiopsis flavida]PSK99404.1 urocanate hydratase [Murinocardiopsis flavida]
MRGVRAQRGTVLRCAQWRQEALLRMLENVLEVGQRPEDLVVYAALGKAARDWPSFDRITATLRTLRGDETLILQSGRPVGVVRTFPGAPRVLSAVNNMVGSWQTPERFYAMADKGMTMWGGLTAAAWQYIGRQGVLQGTYELLRTAAERHFGGAVAGRWLLTAGLGGMGSAQPLAASMLGLSSVTVEADPARLAAAGAAGALDLVVEDLGAALAAVEAARRSGAVAAVGLRGNAAEVFPAVAAQAVRPDIVTDQTAAHDARYGYLPPGMGLDQWALLRETAPEEVERAARAGMAAQVGAMLALAGSGAVVFENGNNLRVQAERAGAADAFDIPGFMERYLRPLFCRGIGPFRWVAVSGDPADLAVLDNLAASLFPERPEVAAWIALARANVPVQGLPARSCWLGHNERSRMAVAANDAVRDGRLSAPVLFTRDHLDAAAMTHPLIGTEGMPDGSDGVSDWPLLDAMLMSATGADLVAVHAGGGGYSGFMQSAGVSIVADGGAECAERLRRALDADTGLGILRYAEAGYGDAAAAVRGAADVTWTNDPATRSADDA